MAEHGGVLQLCAYCHFIFITIYQSQGCLLLPITIVPTIPSILSLQHDFHSQTRTQCMPSSPSSSLTQTEAVSVPAPWLKVLSMGPAGASHNLQTPFWGRMCSARTLWYSKKPLPAPPSPRQHCVHHQPATLCCCNTFLLTGYKSQVWWGHPRSQQCWSGGAVAGRDLLQLSRANTVWQDLVWSCTCCQIYKRIWINLKVKDYAPLAEMESPTYLNRNWFLGFSLSFSLALQKGYTLLKEIMHLFRGLLKLVLSWWRNYIMLLCLHFLQSFADIREKALS